VEGKKVVVVVVGIVVVVVVVVVVDFVDIRQVGCSCSWYMAVAGNFVVVVVEVVVVVDSKTHILRADWRLDCN